MYICSLTALITSYKILRAIVFWWQLRVIDISEIHLRFYCNFSKKMDYDMALEIINCFTILTLLRKTYCHEIKLYPYLKSNQNKLLCLKYI